ncbi:MAG: hypothetical protein OHK0040_08540 [bacterium]
MNLNEAYAVLKRDNPLLKPLSPGAPLWKKVVLDYLSNMPESVELKKAIYTVAVSIDNEAVYKSYFECFNNEKDDELRRYMVEILKDNLNDVVIDSQLTLIGVRVSPYDRYVRQIVSQNVTNALKQLLNQKSFKGNVFLNRLKKNLLNDDNTFTRMNAAIILRNIGDKKSLPEIEKRLLEEKKLLSMGITDIGIPYVIKELERSITYLKERT